MFEDLPATTKMPAISGTSGRGTRKTVSTAPGFRVGWKGFRRSVHGAVRSPGAWFLAVCVGALAVSVSWFGWVMEKIVEGVVVSAEIGGRGIQESLISEDQTGFWSSLRDMHPGWVIAVPAVVWLFVIMIKEVK